MKYARLGDTGLIVLRLAFGTMTFGSDQGPMGAVWKVGQKDADALVGRCLDAGINLFDSADMYAGGQSETILGKALGAKRKEVAICTKAGFRASPSLLRAGLTARHLLDAVEDSLKRLGTDWLDLFVLHKPDPFTPLDETLRACEDLVRSGKVRYVGYSNWPAWQAARAVTVQAERRWTRFCCAQMYYSLVGRDVERDTAPLGRDAGIGMMVWSPLASGFLTGRYTRENPTGGKGSRLEKFDFIPMDREQGWKVIDALGKIAGRRGASVAQVALAWLLAKPGVATVLVGASKRSQLDDNLKAAELELSAKEMSELDALTAPSSLYPDWFNAKTVDTDAQNAVGASHAS